MHSNYVKRKIHFEIFHSNWHLHMNYMDIIAMLMLQPAFSFFINQSQDFRLNSTRIKSHPAHFDHQFIVYFLSKISIPIESLQWKSEISSWLFFNANVCIIYRLFAANLLFSLQMQIIRDISIMFMFMNACLLVDWIAQCVDYTCTRLFGSILTEHCHWIEYNECCYVDV